MSMVNKHYYKIINDEYFWKYLIIIKFNKITLNSIDEAVNKVSYKKIYKGLIEDGLKIIPVYKIMDGNNLMIKINFIFNLIIYRHQNITSIVNKIIDLYSIKLKIKTKTRKKINSVKFITEKNESCYCYRLNDKIMGLSYYPVDKIWSILDTIYLL